MEIQLAKVHHLLRFVLPCIVRPASSFMLPKNLYVFVYLFLPACAQTNSSVPLRRLPTPVYLCIPSVNKTVAN